MKGKKTFAVQEKIVKNIALSAEALSLPLHETHVLTATITPADATHPDITWSSSDPAIVTVSETGEIVAVGFGTASVTATSKNGVAATVKITVTEIIAEKIAIEGATEFYVGENTTFIAKISPENTTFTEIVWSSSNPDVADVDKSGNVKGLTTGVATITATQKDVSASIDIAVNNKATEQTEPQATEDTHASEVDSTAERHPAENIFEAWFSRIVRFFVG